MKKKLATILAEHLRRWGVTDVFGIPGKSVCPVIFELPSQGINFVLSRHECGAGYEAGGYALSSGKLGVAIGTSGPGGTNMLTAAGQAKAYHLPVLFITGHPSMKSTGKSQGQDASQFGTDMVKMFEPVTRFSGRVERADLFPMYLRHAMEQAFTGVRGPVHLCIPFDVYMEEIESFFYPLPTVAPLVSPEVDQVLPLLNEAKHPVLFLGKGVGIANAYEEVRLLSETWGIPVITTPCGRGAFPSTHPLSLGGLGLGGSMESAEYLKSGVDLMIIIGTSLSDMSMAGFKPEMFPKQIVHFDYSISFVGKSIPVPTLPILGDAKSNLQQLLKSVDTRSIPKYNEVATTVSMHSPSSAANSGSMLSAAKVMSVLRRHLPKETILFGDDGSHTFYAIKYYDIYEPGTFFFDDVFGAMGHAIGYSVGAQIGAPEKRIVCLTGDGCAMMHGTEFSTAKNHNASVIFVVLNNGRLDMVEKGMVQMSGQSVGSIYDTPISITQFAESMGLKAFECRTETAVAHAIDAALTEQGPTVIEVIVDPLEIPPTGGRV